jgi:hypothetical protein
MFSSSCSSSAAAAIVRPMGSNSTLRADRAYCLGQPMAEFTRHELRVDCGTLDCPRGRAYRIAARPVTLGQYLSRLRSRGCGRRPIAASLVSTDNPRRRAVLIGNGTHLGPV